MNKYFLWFIILILTLILTPSVSAESNYVLPYPSEMPGSKLYHLRLVLDEIKRYWYFGDFGQFDYNLKLTDKYLIEAKTLFEYKQYLLGYNALKKSDLYLVSIMPNLARAEKNGKNALKKKAAFNEALQKHIEVLEKMELETPDTFIWHPEKDLPTTLNIQKAILNSILLRENNL